MIVGESIENPNTEQDHKYEQNSVSVSWENQKGKKTDDLITPEKQRESSLNIISSKFNFVQGSGAHTNRVSKHEELDICYDTNKLFISQNLRHLQQLLYIILPWFHKSKRLISRNRKEAKTKMNFENHVY